MESPKVLLLCLAASLPGPIAFAQTIDEVIVTEELEASIPLDLSRYGNQVEIITGDEIRAQGFEDVSKALQMLAPGLHIAPKNGPFDYVTASLQGSRRQDILWLVDGVRITNRLYNATSPLDTIPAHMVERIEILKGGQGIFYGTQSVGGAVNIVTRSFASATAGGFGVGVNSNDGYNAHGSFRGGTDTHQFVVFASKDEADGYTPYRDSDLQPSATDRDRGYDVVSGGLKYAWNASDKSRLTLQYIRTTADLDFARPFLNHSTINNREEDIITAKFNYRFNDRLELFVKAYRHNWDTYYTRIYNELDANGDLTGGVVVRNDDSYWGYKDHGFNAMAEFDFGGKFEYVLGIDQQNFSGSDEVWRIGDQEERVTAPFVQIRTSDDLIDSTMLALGVRHNSAANMEDSTVWNLTGKHFFSDTLYLQANIGTSFRMPDAEALFLNEYYDDNNDGIPDGGWFAIGNPDLEPEESRNFNITLGGNLARLEYELTWFRRDITNYIDAYVPITIGGVVGESFINSSDEVNVAGWELEGRVDLSDSFSAQMSIVGTDARLNDSGSQLRDIPQMEAKLFLNYQRPDSPLGLSLSANYVGEVNDRVARGNYVVTDVAGTYRFGNDDQHQLVMRVENLFDEDYATSIGVGTIDATGAAYHYDNLGMQRSLHIAYNYGF